MSKHLQLQSVLKETFNRDDLQLAARRLGLVDGVDFDKSLDEIVFQVIKLAEQRGNVEQLIRAVESERPGLPGISALAAAYGLPAARLPDSPSASQEARAVPTPAISAPASPFTGPTDLQERHAALTKTVSADVLASASQIADFVRRAQATGAVLDARDDRAAAQALINFWTARLASAARSAARTVSAEPRVPFELPHFDDTLLAEFEPRTLREATAAADAWLAQQSEEDQALARRILLRLLRLREDGTCEVLPRALGVCDGLEPRERAEKVLAKLAELGVVRIIPNASGPPDVALRSPELLYQWGRLKEGMERRKQFREDARKWEQKRARRLPADRSSALARLGDKIKHGILRVGALIDSLWRGCMVLLRIKRPSEEFITNDEYVEAEAYRDRTATELELIYQKRQQDKDRNERQQLRSAILTFLVMVFAALSLFALYQRQQAEKQTDIAKKQKDIATQQTDEAKKQAKIALEKTQIAEHEKSLRDKVLDSMMKSKNAVRLASLAETSLAGSPQESLLLATEGWRLGKSLRGEFSKIEEGKLGQAATLGLTMLDEAKRQTEETLRKTLSGIGGLGFNAGLGPITRLAAHESASPERGHALQKIAAIDTYGSLALWNLEEPQTAKILDLIPQAAGLAFTTDGDQLVAWANGKDLALWDLRNANPSRQWITSYQKAEVCVSPYGKWLEMDDYKSQAKLIFLGDPARPKEFPFPLKQTLTSYFSFSDDGRWFARITTSGEALVWRFQGDAKPADVHLKGKTPIKSQVINGEFLDGGRRLVVFFADGWARYWDLKVDDWAQAGEVDLKASAQVPLATAITNLRGTHVLLTPPTSANEPAKTPAIANVAFCFDGRDLDAPPKRLLGFERNCLQGMPVIDGNKGRLLGAIFGPKEDGARFWDLEAKGSPVGGISPTNFLENAVQLAPIPHLPSFVVKGQDNALRLIQEPAQPLAKQAPVQLRGHDGPVRVIGHSQEGRWLITGGQDGTVRAWNLLATSPSAEPYVFRSSPSQLSIRITPDNRWLVVSLADGSLRFRRIEEGSLTPDRHISPTGAKRNAAALFTCQRGRWLLEHLPESTMASLWDLGGDSPKRIGELDVGTSPIHQMLATEDGSLLAVQPDNAPGLLWNLSRREKSQKHEPDGRLPGIILSFIPNSQRILAKTEKAYGIFDFSEGAKESRTIHDVRGQVLNEQVSPNGRTLIVSEQIRPDQIKTWIFDLLGDTTVGHELVSFRPFGAPFFFGDGAFLCSSPEALDPFQSDGARYDGPSYWHLEGKAKFDARKLAKDDSAKKSRIVAVSSDRRCLLTHEEAERFDSWELWRFDGKTRSLKTARLDMMSSAKFTSDSSWLICVMGGALRVYDVNAAEMNNPLRELAESEFQGVITSAARTPDGRWLALVGQDWRIRVWDLNEKEPKPVLLLPGPMLSAPTEMLFSKDGARLYSFFPHAVRVSRTQMEGKEGVVEKAAEAVGRNFRKREWPSSLLGPYRATFESFPVEHYEELLDEKASLKAGDKPYGPQKKLAKEYKIQLTEGRLYDLSMRSSSIDTYLVLLDSGGQEVARDDDSGGSLNARIRYVCRAGGPFTVIATSFRGGTGPFHLTVESVHLQLDERKGR
jgi:WD40 repeat protein